MSDSTTTAAKQQQPGGVSTVPASPPDPHNDSSNSNSSDSFVELSFHEDAISLQDLIDSELALRVSTDTIEDDAVEEMPAEAPVPIKLDLLDLKVADEDLSDSPEHTASYGALKGAAVAPVPIKLDLLDLKVSDGDMSDSPEHTASYGAAAAPVPAELDLLDLKVSDGDASDSPEHVNALDQTDEDSVPSDFILPDRLPASPTVDSQIYDDILDSLRDDAALDSLDQGAVKTDPLVDDTSQDSPTNTLSSSSADAPAVAKPAVADANTLFILAEQQGELTQADILFYNTFNQVQSNGDDFLSSPEAVNSEEASPKGVAAFDPFATIAAPELESPSVESVPLPRTSTETDVVQSPLVEFDGPAIDVGSSTLEAGSVAIEPESPVSETCPAFPAPELGSPDGDESANVGGSDVDLGSPASDPSASISEKQSPVFEITPPLSEADGPLFDDDEAALFEPPATPPRDDLPDDTFAQAEAESIAALPRPGLDKAERRDPQTNTADNNRDPTDLPFDTNYSSFETNLVDVSAANNRNLCATAAAAAANGATTNGTQSGGFKSNGITSNGITSNGVKTNGITSNGLCPIVVVDSEDFEAPSSPEHERSSDNSVNEEKKKKKKSDGGETKTKRTKKTKKEEKENISVQDSQFGSACSTPSEVLLEDAGHLSNVSVKELRRSFGDLTNLEDLDAPDNKSSFSKFDALSKKTVLHVRSGDASKAQKQFSQASSGDVGSSSCRSCGKQVFQMEQVKAERSVWHKNCFRCHDCNKQLTVDIYSSHEGVVYCKPHFKELFKPKAVVEDEAPGSDKPDLGLEELAQLNVKSRFQAFEKAPEEAPAVGGAVSVKRSPSILSKLARFQAGGGGDVGVSDAALNGAPPSDESSSEEEADEEAEGAVVRANRKHKERPVNFAQMEDVKGRWETGTTKSREERREERKLEISNIRSRLFMGHQGKMKEAYQAAVSESTATTPGKRDVEVGGDRARCIKERFERGQVNDEDGDGDDPKGDARSALDEDLADAGYSKKSRSLFLELDATAATAAKTATAAPAPRPLARDESFRNRVNNTGASPEREIYRDPTIVRGDDPVEETQVLRSQTASKMLSFFKHMEAAEPDKPQGPKPLKRFTPPPDCELNRNDSDSSEDEGESSEEGDEDEADDGHDPSIIRASDKMEDAFLKEAQSAAVRAKSLRAKFERWEEREIEREKAAEPTGTPTPGAVDGDTPSLDTTRSLRARFESMSHEVDKQAADKQPRTKVNRFVEIQTSTAEFCSACDKKVYHLEKVETGGKIFHKNCFRCMQCNCVLRMDTYTLNGGRLYCLPHFKQGFFTRGNYDEGFGADQHKRKWASDKRDTDILLSLTTAADR